MATFHSLQIPPPSNWQDFEILCCDLWREIWKDPNAQRNGRQGQPQHGVDVYGRPDQGKSWAGVQCKGKDNFGDKCLTEKEVRSEVKKAKSFKPKLSQFIIATTGPKDATVEKLAREITDDNIKNGLFSVHIWGWNDIKECLAGFPDLLEKHYAELSPATYALKQSLHEIKQNTKAILDQNADDRSLLSSLPEKISTAIKASYADISVGALTSEYQAEIDHSRDLINNYKPIEALKFLENLKSRIWSNAEPIVRYRILTNIGAARLYLKEEKEAAKLFIEALQYNAEDEKAIYNAGLGHLLLGQLKDADALANRVLAKNPASGLAYSIIIQTSSVDESLEDIISKVPSPYRNEPNVANAISYLARKRGSLIQSRKWLEIAVENDKENLPDLKGALGEILLELVIEDGSIIYGIQFKGEQEKQIQDSIDLLTYAWDAVAEGDLRKLRLTWIANRGLAKSLLGDFDGAINDLEIALALDPQNGRFTLHRALVAYKYNDKRKAISLLKTTLSSKDTPAAPLLLAQVLREEGDFSEARDTINRFLNTNPPEELNLEAKRILIALHIEAGNFDDARQISEPILASDRKNVLNLVYAARIERSAGNADDALALLNEANKHITDSSPIIDFLELADGFYFSEQFEDAGRLYEKVVNKTLDTPFTRRLINSYYRAGKIDKALQICQILRIRYGPLEYISEIQSAIYEEIGNLPEAKKVCNEYLDSFPDDFRMQLRLAAVNLRSGNLGDLDKFLNSPVDIGALSLESGIQLSHLYSARNLCNKALQTIYEIRRKFFNIPDAHIEYIGLCLQREKIDDELLNISKVSLDTAVCIKGDAGKEEWYILEDRKDPDINRREINLTHPLAQRLLGKLVKEKVLLKESSHPKEFGEILEIKSKYVYSFNESLSLFGILFPDTPGFSEVRLQTPEKEGDIPKVLKPILDQISNSSKVYRKAANIYKKGKITIGTFANLIGRNVLDTWSFIISTPDIGLKCSIGAPEEMNSAKALLKTKCRLIADLISIITLYGINAGDAIIKAFGKLGIAQSTLDLLQNAIIEWKGLRLQGIMTIGMDGDQFVRQEITAKQAKRHIELLENIKEWIETNCDVLPCKQALYIERNYKQKLETTIGSSFIDTILIAREFGNILYCEDEPSRSFAKKGFNVPGVWTQPLLMHCLDIGILDRTKYNEMIISLINSHYYYTSIDSHILIEAAKQANWCPSDPYANVVELLKGESSDEDSSIIVGTNFLFELWKQPILPHWRDSLILSLLVALTSNRNPRVINKLERHVKRRFSLLPLACKHILLLIDAWKQSHVIS